MRDHKPAETSLGNAIPSIAIHGETLTDKDFICIAQHLQEYQREFIGHEPNVPNACETCRYEAQCFNTGVSTDWFETFAKVDKITGVNCVNHAEDAASRSRNNHLTYDDWRCMALHLRYLINTSYRRGENRPVPFPCQLCYNEGWTCEKGLPFLGILCKLERLSGIEISAFRTSEVFSECWEYLQIDDNNARRGKDDIKKRVEELETRLSDAPESICRKLLEAVQRTISQSPGV